MKAKYPDMFCFVFLMQDPLITNPSEGGKAALPSTKPPIAQAVWLGLPVEGNVRSKFLSYPDYHETEFGGPVDSWFVFHVFFLFRLGIMYSSLASKSIHS